ncbi:MAG: hypothetical protein M3Y54_19200 [Bacteroidota bacterium]|nr:hypothetical protein [Bacteroidota bacterium]
MKNCTMNIRHLAYALFSAAAALALPACSPACNGSIETTVLYAKPGPGGVGRDIYVDVVNKPDLGIKRTLQYEGKEFGTFEHVVIIHDATSRFAANRSICFSKFRVGAPATGGDLTDEGLPQIEVE